MKTVERNLTRVSRLVLMAGAVAAALTLAACGDDAANTAAPAAPTTTTTAATPPPATTPAPAVPAFPTGPLNLSVADLVGQWALTAEACADPAQVMNISSTAVIHPDGTRSTINATAVVAGGFTLQLAQTVNGIRRSSVWNFSSTTPTLPVLGLNIAIDGAAPVTWVRCSAGVI